MQQIRFFLDEPPALLRWGRTESPPPLAAEAGQVLLLAQLSGASQTARGTLHAGAVMLLIGTVTQPVVARPGETLLYALFAPRGLEVLPDAQPCPGALPALFRPVDWPALHPMLRRLGQEDFEIPHAMRAAALCFLLHELFFQHRLSLESRKNGSLDPLLRYLHHHFHEPLSIESLAERFDYNPQYLSRMFRDKSGLTIHSYVTRLRMQESVRLLQEQGLTVREISRRVGYTSEKLFVRNFKQAYGMPPSHYRTNHLEGRSEE